MNCPECASEVPISARFCPSCGSMLVTEDDIVDAKDITLEWLAEILASIEYEVSIEEGSRLIARHIARPNIILTINSVINIVAIQTIWNFRKLGWGEKSEFLSALNSANGSNWLCNFYARDPYDTLNVSSFIFLATQLSKRDVLLFLESYEKSMWHSIDESGLKKFS